MFGAQQHYQQPPNYGGYYPQHNMGMQQPAPPPQYGGPQQTIITINDNDDGSPCQYCAQKTNNLPRRTAGCSTCAWCLILTPCLLCFIPCCMDGCKDI